MKISDNLSVVPYSNDFFALVENTPSRAIMVVYRISPYADIIKNGELSKGIIKAYEDYYNNISKNMPRNRR